MEITVRQVSKRDTRTTINVTTEEAVQLIQGLAAGIRATTLAGWDKYNSGYFQLDKYSSSMVFVVRE